MGGLTTIEEKSMGAFAKCGTRPISGVIKVAQRPPAKGLYVLDSVPDPSPFLFGYSNPNDSEGILDLISCGTQIVVFTTGRGSVIGSVISPVSGVTELFPNPKTPLRHPVNNRGSRIEKRRTAYDLLMKNIRMMAQTLSHLTRFVNHHHPFLYLSSCNCQI